MEKQFDNNVYDEFVKLPLLEINDNWEAAFELKMRNAKSKSSSKSLSIKQLPVLLAVFLLLNGALFYTLQKEDNTSDNRQEILQHLSDELLVNSIYNN